MLPKAQEKQGMLSTLDVVLLFYKHSMSSCVLFLFFFRYLFARCS